MKSRHFVIFLLVASLASALYVFRDLLIPKEALTTWDFVPNTSSVIWEPSDPIEVWNKFIETEHWKNFSANSKFTKVNQSLMLLDSLLGGEGRLSQVLKQGDFLLSAHTISSTDFDFVFYLRLDNPEYQEEFIGIVDHLQEPAGTTASTRLLEGQTIHELKTKSNIFSYLLIDNVFVGSFSPFLLEDAVRVYNDSDKGFKNQNSSAFNQTSLQFDAGDIYLNLDNLHTFLGLFFASRDLPAIEFLESLSGTEFMDINFDDRQMYLNGFLIPEEDGYLSVFKDQQPVSIDFQDMITENTSMVFYQSFSDPGHWYQQLQKFWQGHNPKQEEIRSEFISTYDFDVERLTRWLKGHVVLSLQESAGLPPKVLLMGTNDQYETMNQFNKLAEAANAKVGDTLYYENYREIPIYLLNIEELPAKLFGDWYSGFQRSYFSAIDDYFILSDDIEAIKQVIDNREDEYTWRHSVDITRFLEQNLEESNIGLFVDVPHALGYIGPQLTPPWKEGLETNLTQIRQLDMIGIQYSNFGERFYSSMVTSQRKISPRSVAATSNSRPSVSVDFDTLIQRKPKVVRNHVDNTYEVLVQDMNNKLYLVDGQGDKLWERGIDGAIKSEIFQIDYYKNNKLQYLFITDSSLYLIDRNGDDVENYPIAQDIASDHLDVIDYDRSRNYRFLLAKESGEVFLLDKTGTKLEGWNPLDLEESFDVYPFHMRVRSKDVFVSILENGIVHLNNRRGEVQAGFPLDLDVNVSGEVYYKIRGGFKETIVEVVSEEGEVIEFNLEGKVVNRTQLYKPSTRSKFTLVEDATRRSYIVARQDLGRLGILNKSDELRFEKDFPGDRTFETQYYNFGSDRELFIVQHAEPGVLLVYDGFGAFKFSRMPGDFPVSIIHRRTRQTYEIYSAQADQLLIYTLNE